VAAKGLRYSNFADRIDLDEFYVAINFSPTSEDSKGNDIGSCPLPFGNHQHGDLSGKFAVHRDKMVYNCWVCGGGSILDLAMHMTGKDDHEATAWLFEFTKAREEKGEEFLARLNKTMRPEDTEKVGESFYNPKVIEKWFEPGHPYFAERGIPYEVAHYFKLGFNERHRKYPPKRNGVPIDDPFEGPAVIFPHFFNEKLRGWQVRWLTDDRPKWCKKYDNNNDFPRIDTVWGWDFARKQNKPPVVVESVPTAAFIIGLGFPSLSTFGSNVSEQQVKLLRSFQQGVVLAPDKGSAGENNYWRVAGELQRYVPVKWLDPPSELADKEDLNDLRNDPDLVVNYVENAPWLFESTKK
jgi:DNA primase